jgi:PAS domain S-box-containing protein
MTPELDPGITRRLGQLVFACSLLAIAFGLWVLTGWMFDSQIVKSILPGQVAVKANTAACFLLIGFALWVLRKQKACIASGWKVAARTATVLTSIIGLLSLLEFVFGWDLRIDQLLFNAGAGDIPGSVRPGLMSPITALDFLLLGPALLLLDAQSRLARWSVHLLSCGAAVASIFGILDFALDAQTTHTYISPATAIMLFVLSFATIFARTESGFGALVASVTYGGTLTRRLFPSAIFVPLLIGWLRFKGETYGDLSQWSGVTLMTVLTILLLGSLTVWTGITIDQSERGRRRAQDAATQLAAIVTSSNDAIFAKNLAGIVTSWNPAAEAMYGLRADEMIGQPISRLVPANRSEDVAVIMESVKQGRPIRHHETTRVRNDGQLIHVSLSVSPLRDAAGRVIGASTIARDITARKQAEADLQESQEQFRALFNEMLSGFALFEPIYDNTGKPWDFVYLEVNPAHEAHCGLHREQVLGKTIREVIPNLEPFWIESYERVAITGESLHFEQYSQSLDRWLEFALFRTRKGRVAAIFTDVSARKRAEAALQESEAKFRGLSELVPQMVWACTADGLTMYFNHRWVEYTGLTLDESYGHGWNTPFHEDDKKRAWDAWTQAVATGDTYRVECRLRAADGSYRWFLIRGVPLRKSGNIDKWFGTCTDIDDLKRAEEQIGKLNQELEQRVNQRTAQLHESERRVRRKLESILSPEGDLGHLELADLFDIPAVQSLVDDFYSLAHIPMSVLDLNGNALISTPWQEICTDFHRANAASCQNCRESDRELSTGVRPGEFKLYKCKNNLWDVVTPIMVGDQHVGNLFSGQFFFADETVEDALFRSQARRYGFDEPAYIAALDRVPRFNRKDVETGMTFYTKLAQVLSQIGYSSIKLARSMTETGRINAELAASVKELEAFTYSVSHDLRAPLRHISGFSKILAEEFGSDLPQEAQHHVQRIQEGTRRMGILIDDLLNLARVGRRDLTMQVSGLKSVIDEVIADLAPEYAGRRIEWKIGNLPYVQCDSGLMKQVFQNLLSNSVKFTRPREQALIEVGQKDQDGAPVVFVRDNGVGFNMNYAEKLFGVFQRLHRPEDFEGTGVGLATVQRIIQKHGGRIWAEAEVDKGATFYFTLGGSETTDLKSKAAMVGDKE